MSADESAKPEAEEKIEDAEVVDDPAAAESEAPAEEAAQTPGEEELAPETDVDTQAESAEDRVGRLRAELADAERAAGFDETGPGHAPIVDKTGAAVYREPPAHGDVRAGAPTPGAPLPAIAGLPGERLPGGGQVPNQGQSPVQTQGQPPAATAAVSPLTPSAPEVPAGDPRADTIAQQARQAEARVQAAAQGPRGLTPGAEVAGSPGEQLVAQVREATGYDPSRGATPDVLVQHIGALERTLMGEVDSKAGAAA